MILGYVMKANSSNDGNFFDGSEGDDVLCPNCGSCLNYDYFPKSIDIKPSKKYDVSYTNDLRLLFSRRFVEFCTNILGADELFRKVNVQGQELFYMIPKRVLEFDVERRKTRFENPCSICGGYESIVGAKPAFLKITEPIKNGFFRSDVAFASGKHKAPLFFVSVDWMKQLSLQKFRGIEFSEVTL